MFVHRGAQEVSGNLNLLFCTESLETLSYTAVHRHLFSNIISHLGRYILEDAKVPCDPLDPVFRREIDSLNLVVILEEFLFE